MRKNKVVPKITAEQAVGFLENFRLMLVGLDKKSKAISIRIPENIIEAYKALAKAEDRSYQAMMVEALRAHLKLRK